MKFTFKTEHPTGKWKSFSHDCHIIKYNKIEVGSIGSEHPYSIRLMVMKSVKLNDNNPNCPWKWIQLRKESTSLIEAKEFLNANIKTLLDRVDLIKR